MKFENKSLLMFDLDGTLVDSAPDIASAANQMLSELGRDTFTPETIRHWIGNGASVMVKRALSGSSEIDPELCPTLFQQALEQFLTIYQQNPCERTTLYPSVKDTLAKLKALNYQIAVVTNKPGVFVMPILERLQLSQYIDFVIGGDQLATRKPEPDQLHHTCEYFKLAPQQAVMIGDSHNDILAAKAAKIDSIGLTYGYNYGEDIGKHQPQAVFDDFAQLLEVLPG